MLARSGLIFACSRIVTLLAAATGDFLLGLLGPGPALNSTVGDGLGRWDGVWYLRVAAQGYVHHVTVTPADIPGTNASFFPVFPLLIRFAHAATGLTPLRSALGVVAVAGVLDATLVWLLARRRWGTAAADRACALFCFFPGAFVLSLAYSEAVMLTFVLACFAALERRWWIAAGVCAALSTATRPNAVVIVGCCAWAATAAVIRHRDWRSLIAPLLAPLGFLAFMAFLWRRTGSWSAWFTVEKRVWHERVDLTAVWHRLTLFSHRPWKDIDITVFVVALIFTVVAFGLMVRVRPPAEWWIWSGGVVALAAASATLGLRPRFVLSAFPLVIVGGRDLKGAAFAAVLGLSAGVLVLLTIVDLTGLFVP